MTGSGRLPEAASGCVVDSERVEPRLGWQAALEKFEGQLRVDSDPSRLTEAVVRQLARINQGQVATCSSPSGKS